MSIFEISEKHIGKCSKIGKKFKIELSLFLSIFEISANLYLHEQIFKFYQKNQNQIIKF